ncbi:hypothetical protein FS837_008952 [Tulasnella sp. UAMH 9824]|nr:hypothetical protein FS837_008952 [Tulasnella sp. UAMH 9824]
MVQPAREGPTDWAVADLESRRNDGIALVEFYVVRDSPTFITYKWSSHRRSPSKFTVWFRNVKTQEHYQAKQTVWTGDGRGQLKLSSLRRRTGEYQLVLTEYNNYRNAYAHSSTFVIHNGDF